MFLRKKIGIIGFILGLSGVISCSELPCDETNSIQLNAGFYYFVGNTLTDTLIPNLIMHYGMEDQSIYSDTIKTKTNKIQFPLSMIADSSIVIFEFDSINFDTLVFHYNRSLQLESHECGFINFFEITSIDATANNIDSVWISNNVVDYGEKDNIKVYF